MPKKKMDSKNMKRWVGLMLCVGVSINAQAQPTMGRESGLSASIGILKENVVNKALNESSKKASNRTSIKSQKQKLPYCLRSLKSNRCELLDMSSFGNVEQNMIGKKVKVMGYIREEYDVDPKTTEKLNSKLITVVVSMKYAEE